ncbi:MAG: tetratricopeptide repeat protein, partial [Gammaproteobacteria bacterium]
MRTALARDPARPRAWDRLGELLLREGDAVGAVEAFDRMLQAEPRNPAGPAKLCTALIAARDWGNLARVAEAWSTIDEGSADAWRCRSRAAWEQGLFGVAIDHCEKALAIRPTDVDERVRAARMCLQAQEFGRAGTLLADAALQSRGHPEVLSATAMLRICEGRFEEAESALLESLSVASGNIPAL